MYLIAYNLCLDGHGHAEHSAVNPNNNVCNTVFMIFMYHCRKDKEDKKVLCEISEIMKKQIKEINMHIFIFYNHFKILTIISNTLNAAEHTEKNIV